MNSLPDPDLRTERLRLRFPRPGDRADLMAIYGNPAVARFLSQPVWTQAGEAEAWLQHAYEGRAHGDALQCVIEHHDAATVIGTCAVHHIHAQCRRAEIGYVLGHAHQGHGYMHEALVALLAYAFDTLDLRRMEADIDPRNTASARSLERLGFTREGHLRERWVVAGEVSDSYLYGLLRNEWRPS